MEARYYAMPSLGLVSLSSRSLSSQSFFSPRRLREGWLLEEEASYCLDREDKGGEKDSL
jgi:hypothetical protein